MKNSQVILPQIHEISDEDIAKCFEQAINAYDDPNLSWGIPREYAIDTVRELLELQAQKQTLSNAAESQVAEVAQQDDLCEHGHLEARLTSRRFVSQRC